MTNCYTSSAPLLRPCLRSKLCGRKHRDPSERRASVDLRPQLPGQIADRSPGHAENSGSFRQRRSVLRSCRPMRPCLERRGDSRRFSLGQPRLDWVLPGIYSPSKMPVSEFLVNAEDESARVDVAHGPSDATLISLVYKAEFLISSLDNLDLHPLTTRAIDGPSFKGERGRSFI